MKQIKSFTDIRGLGTILSVWAHPDDESFLAAGIMATAIQNGQRVICVTATKGEKGIQDESRWPSGRLADIRAEEISLCLDALGIQEHHWLDYPDGECKNVDQDEAVQKVQNIIVKYQPDSILTFGPDGMTGHDDHRTVSSWVTRATKDTKIPIYHAVELRAAYEKMREADDKFNIFFNIDKPPIVEPDECDILLNLSDELLVTKYQCLYSMPSQTDAMFNHFGQDMICAMICSEAFALAK